MRLQLDVENELLKAVKVLQQETCLVGDIPQQQKVDKVDEGGLAQIVAVPTAILRAGDPRKHDTQFFVVDAIQSNRQKSCRQVAVDSCDLHAVTRFAPTNSKLSVFS